MKPSSARRSDCGGCDARRRGWCPSRALPLSRVEKRPFRRVSDGSVSAGVVRRAANDWPAAAYSHLHRANTAPTPIGPHFRAVFPSVGCHASQRSARSGHQPRSTCAVPQRRRCQSADAVRSTPTCRSAGNRSERFLAASSARCDPRKRKEHRRSGAHRQMSVRQPLTRRGSGRVRAESDFPACVDGGPTGDIGCRVSRGALAGAEPG